MANSSISGSSAYASGSDFIIRYDVRTLGDLLSDLGVRVAADSVASHPTITAFLKEASGEVEADCMAGGRYSVTDLGLIAGNALELLKRLVVDTALWNMLNRRPDPNRMIPPSVLKSLALREKLADGHAIFALTDQANAGKNVVRADTPTPRLTTTATRLFGVVLPEDNL